MSAAGNSILQEHRDAIRSEWLGRAISVFPDRSRRFLGNTENAFANPAGAILSQGIDELLDGLFADAPPAEFRKVLTPMIRLLAVQDAPPSQSLAFISALKEILRRVAGHDGRMPSELDARIDQVQLLAFDVYVECREKLFSIRLDELRRNRG